MMYALLITCLRLAGCALRMAAFVLDPQATRRLAAERRRVQRETWRRIASGADLPQKVKAWLEAL